MIRTSLRLRLTARADLTDAEVAQAMNQLRSRVRIVRRATE